MDGKVFDLLTKMYNEMQDGFKEIRADIKELKTDVNDLKNGQLLLEDKLEDTRKTLFDGYTQNSEQLNEIKSVLKDLSEKVEKQEVEIKVIKGRKQAR